MSYEPIKARLKQIQAKLNKNNHKEVKLELIEIQRQISSVDLVSMHRAELKEAMEGIFERIRMFQQEEQETFEKQALNNFSFLKEKIVEAIDFTQENLNDHDAIWQKLLEVQQHFKGTKLQAEQREQLYDTLQKLFDLAKKRREAAIKEQEKFSSQHFDKLDDEVAIVVSQSETADMDKAWSMLLETKDKVMNSHLIHTHSKRLLDKLQEGFEMVKMRKEERWENFAKESHENADAISEKLKLAAWELDNNEVFKEKWELLLNIQQEFRSRKLEKDVRQSLYGQLQGLFLRLKNEQNLNQADFEEKAESNYQYLKPLVEEAFKQAQSTLEFRKTKGFLIKVQGEFKGRKMRSTEREKLYGKLQNAFDILNKRLDEYIASRKDVREFRVEGRMSDVEMKIDQMEKILIADRENLSLLESAYENSVLLESKKKDAENLGNQIEIMKAAIGRKERELEELNNELLRLQNNKDKLDELE